MKCSQETPLMKIATVFEMDTNRNECLALQSNIIVIEQASQENAFSELAIHYNYIVAEY